MDDVRGALAAPPAESLKTEEQPDASGEMSRRVREADWSETSLGSMEVWPQSLRTSVDICLASAHPTMIWW